MVEPILEQPELRRRPPREQLAALLADKMDAFGIRSQRRFAAHLGLGLSKVNRWLNAAGPRPTAKDWAVLAERLSCNGDLHSIQDAMSARPRRVRFKGFQDGDGI